MSSENGLLELEFRPTYSRQASKHVEEIQEGIAKVKKFGKLATKELQLMQEILSETRSSSSGNSLSPNSRFSSSRINLTDLFINEKSKHSLESEEDDEETATLRRLNQENRVLLVQLEAAHEALFAHQRKTQDNMENVEEEMQDLKNKISESIKREETAMDKIRALEVALQEMQDEKQLVQKKNSESMEELSNSESKKQYNLEAMINTQNHELEQKEEENIRLCMTILKVQEDLCKENHQKEEAIENRDQTIIQLEKALADLRLESEARNMTDTFPTNEGNINTENDEEQDATSASVSVLRKKTEEQETELNALREENETLRRKLSQTHEIKQNGFSQNEHMKNGDGDSTLVKSLVQNNEINKPETKELLKVQKKLRETEDMCRKTQERADHMTYLLNQKIIELNKLQLTLSGQTKEMIQLEKAYFQLRCHLSKGFRTLPSSARSSRVDLSTT